jgi:hypothetical protein
MATNVQSRAIVGRNFPEDNRVEHLECQAGGIHSLLSSTVWRDVMDYLGDLFTRNVTVPEFLAGLSTGLIREIQTSLGRVEFQQNARDDKIIIFGDFNHGLVHRGAEADLEGSDSRINLSAPDIMFIQLRAAARSVANEMRRSEIISNIERLEVSRGTLSYQRAYEDFIASVADYIGAFGSFVPTLTKLLSEK